MKTYKVWIPVDLPTLNDVLDKRAAHWSKYSKLKKQVHRDLSWFVQRLPKHLDRIRLTLIWLTATRNVDPDNIVFAKKFILDSLVEHEIIPNDGWKQVAAPMLDFWGLRSDQQDTGVWVIVSEVPKQSHTEHAVIQRALTWHQYTP